MVHRVQKGEEFHGRKDRGDADQEAEGLVQGFGEGQPEEK